MTTEGQILNSGTLFQIKATNIRELSEGVPDAILAAEFPLLVEGGEIETLVTGGGSAPSAQAPAIDSGAATELPQTIHPQMPRHDWSMPVSDLMAPQPRNTASLAVIEPSLPKQDHMKPQVVTSVGQGSAPVEGAVSPPKSASVPAVQAPDTGLPSVQVNPNTSPPKSDRPTRDRSIDLPAVAKDEALRRGAARPNISAQYIVDRPEMSPDAIKGSTNKASEIVAKNSASVEEPAPATRTDTIGPSEKRAVILNGEVQPGRSSPASVVTAPAEGELGQETPTPEARRSDPNARAPERPASERRSETPGVKLGRHDVKADIVPDKRTVTTAESGPVLRMVPDAPRQSVEPGSPRVEAAPRAEPVTEIRWVRADTPFESSVRAPVQPFSSMPANPKAAERFMPSTRDVPPTPVNQAVDTRTYFKARPTSGPSPDTGPDSDRMVHRALPEPLASKVDNAEKVELKVAEPPGVTPNTAARGGDVVQAAPSAVRSPQITQHAAVAQQVVQAMVSADGQDVEIRLSPEELGTVRIVMAPREAGVHVTIYADRPETLDLLRRGEAEFSADLQDQGFEQSTFTFSQGATDESDTDRSSPGDMELPTAAMDPERPLAGVSDRLDLRV